MRECAVVRACACALALLELVLEYFPTASFGRVFELTTNPIRSLTRLDVSKIALLDDRFMTA